MSFSFPRQAALLHRTKLAYINLASLLSDGKRDRSARVPGFVVIEQGSVCDVLFLMEGETLNAVRITGTDRTALPVPEVLAGAERMVVEGERGQIGYYTAPELQLRAMIASAVAPVAAGADQVRDLPPDRLLPGLRERQLSGVVEVSVGDREFHYLVLEKGRYRAGYFGPSLPDGGPGERVRTLLTAASPPRFGVHLLPESLPRQAPLALVDLYRGLMQALRQEMAERADRGRADRILEEARDAVSPRHPAVGRFRLEEEGAVTGSAVMGPGDLTAGVAAWVIEALGTFGDEEGVDPVDVLTVAARERRYALDEQGFMDRLPWPVGS